MNNLLRSVKAIRNMLRMNKAVSLLEEGKAENAKEFLLSLRSELNGEDIHFHLLMAIASRDLGDYSECVEQLGLAKDIFHNSSQFNKEEQKYLQAFIVEVAMNIKGEDLSTLTLEAFREIISVEIDYSLVQDLLVRRYPLANKLD